MADYKTRGNTYKQIRSVYRGLPHATNDVFFELYYL